jgi:hypothetical protein
MSKERTDEFLQWRGLIDQPEDRPDQVLDDKEATWQKLAERLGDRRRNRLSGYRIAAACLLFALMIPAARLFQDHHGIAGTPGIRRPATSSDLRRTALPASATAIREQRVHVITTMGVSPAPTSRPRTTRQDQAKGHTPKAHFANTDRTHFPLLANIPSLPFPITAAPPDPASQSPIPRPSRTKELKVVHQNEIRGGNISSPSVGATSGDPLINILLHRFRQQPAPAPPPTEDPALLKIKLSPSN